MFNFHKYIAGLSILGISIQSIFGYGIILLGAGVAVKETISTIGISAAGTATGDTATPRTPSHECSYFGIDEYYDINFYNQTNPYPSLIKNDQYDVPGINNSGSSIGAFQGYFGTGGGNEYTGGVYTGNTGDALWAGPVGGFGNPITRYYTPMCIDPVITYDVTPVDITTPGVGRTYTISMNDPSCSTLFETISGTTISVTGAIIPIYKTGTVSLSNTGYYQYIDQTPELSKPGDNSVVDVTIAGTGACASATPVTKRMTTNVPPLQINFSVVNPAITTTGVFRSYNITSPNGTCNMGVITRLGTINGSPINDWSGVTLPYSFSDTTPSQLGDSADLTITISGTGNCAGVAVTGSPVHITTNITPPATVPGAPTGVNATAGNGQATVSFTPPGSNGGAPITSYTVTSSPGNITSTSAGSPITVTGLTNGTSYTFTVTATNSVGTSSSSAPSNSVTPTSGVTPISGSCGTSSGTSLTSTPSTNLCTTGTPGSVTDGGVGGRYSWSCGGSGGGASMSCSASHISTTQTGACSGGLPTNATANAGTGFLQTWSGTEYAPSTMSYTPNATGACSFSCNPGYTLTVDGLSFIDTDIGNPILFPMDPLIVYSCILSSPSMVTIASPIGTTNTNTPRFTGSGGTGVMQVVIYKSGGIFLGSGLVQSGSYSFTSALSLSDGTHTIIVTGKDSLGNSGSTATGVFIVDTMAPIPPTVNPVANPLTTTTPTFSGSGESGATLEIRSGGTGGVLLCQTTISGSGSWSCALSSPSLSVGSTSLTFISKDSVSNTSSTSLTVNVVLPTTPSPISVGPGGGSYSANAGGGNIGGSSIPVGVQNMLVGQESAIPLDIFLTGRRLTGYDEAIQDPIFERESFREKRARISTDTIGLHDPLPSTEICELDEKFSNDELEFTDISGHWARSFIEKLARYWIVRNQANYRPDDTMTRGEFLALAMRAVRCNYDSEALESYSSDGFSDVRKSMTVDKYLGVAQEKGWIEGSGRFRPDDRITRAEAVEMVMNIIKPEETNKKIGFLDLGKLQKSTQEIILMAQSFSIVGGKNDGYFDPHGALTRGEAAKIIARSFVRE